MTAAYLLIIQRVDTLLGLNLNAMMGLRFTITRLRT